MFRTLCSKVLATICGAGVLLAGASAASAQTRIIIERSRPNYYPNYNRFDSYDSFGLRRDRVAPYIYGSPIPTPILVDPRTGTLPRSNFRTFGRSYPGYSRYGRNSGVTIIIGPQRRSRRGFRRRSFRRRSFRRRHF